MGNVDIINKELSDLVEIINKEVEFFRKDILELRIFEDLSNLVNFEAIEDYLKNMKEL